MYEPLSWEEVVNEIRRIEADVATTRLNLPRKGGHVGISNRLGIVNRHLHTTRQMAERKALKERGL